MPLPSASLKSLAPHSHHHLQPPQSTAISPFLSLPAELRRQIYSYLFRDGKIYQLTLYSEPSFDYTYPSKPLQIRLVCRQIHEETTEFIFEHAEVLIHTPSIALFEERLKGITLPEANWRRIRRLMLYIKPPDYVKVTESHLEDFERFFEKYFPPGEEGKVKLKKLCIIVFPDRFSSDLPQFFWLSHVASTGDHRLLRWANGIEGLRNAAWNFNEYEGRMLYRANWP